MTIHDLFWPIFHPVKHARCKRIAKQILLPAQHSGKIVKVQGTYYSVYRRKVYTKQYLGELYVRCTNKLFVPKYSIAYVNKCKIVPKYWNSVELTQGDCVDILIPIKM